MDAAQLNQLLSAALANAESTADKNGTGLALVYATMLNTLAISDATEAIVAAIKTINTD